MPSSPTLYFLGLGFITAAMLGYSVNDPISAIGGAVMAIVCLGIVLRRLI